MLVTATRQPATLESTCYGVITLRIQSLDKFEGNTVSSLVTHVWCLWCYYKTRRQSFIRPTLNVSLFNLIVTSGISETIQSCTLTRFMSSVKGIEHIIAIFLGAGSISFVILLWEQVLALIGEYEVNLWLESRIFKLPWNWDFM